MSIDNPEREQSTIESRWQAVVGRANQLMEKYISLPEGSPNKEEAMYFVREVIRVNQAKWKSLSADSKAEYLDGYEQYAARLSSL